MSEPGRPRASASGMAGRFVRVRQDHAREMAEDYTELVLELEASGPVRPADMARRLGVSHVTVLRALARMARDGFIIRDETQGITLSPDGRALGRACRARHQLVVSFLEKLGVPPEIAAVDVEGMEHHLSRVTLERMAGWVEWDTEAIASLNPT
jgi:DtxR family manganese transport transcriptional regulator